MTARVEIVDSVFESPEVEAALTELRATALEHKAHSNTLFDLAIEEKHRDNEAPDDTRDRVSDLLELVHVVDAETKQATIYDADIGMYFGGAVAAAFWRAHKAGNREDEAREAVVSTWNTLTEDELVRWGLERCLTGGPRHKMQTAARETVSALDRTDTILRQHAGETLTHINAVGYISTTLNDGQGLRADAAGNHAFTLSSTPTYMANLLDYLSRAPNLYVDNACRISSIDASRLSVFEDDWSAALRSSTWRERAPLLFGDPVEGPLDIGTYTGNDTEIDTEFYTHAIGRARLVAALSIGNLNLDEVRHQGFVVIEQA